MVQTLLSLGVDYSIKGLSGTAYQVAKDACQENVRKLLARTYRVSCINIYKGLNVASCTEYTPLSPTEQKEAIAQAIASARETNRLNLAHLGLQSIPNDAFELASLEELDLSYNSLTSLPPEISRFTALKCLKLDANKLSSLPQCVFLIAFSPLITTSLMVPSPES